MSKKITAKKCLELKDEFNNFDFYSERHLDTLAAFMNVCSKCTAVVFFDNCIYYSFNGIPGRDYKNYIKSCHLFMEEVCKGTYDMETLLCYYLTTNRDFSAVLTNRQLNELIDEKKKEVQSQFKVGKKPTFGNCSELLGAYKNVVCSLKKDFDEYSLLRPLQDSVKLHQLLKRSDCPILNVRFEQVDNKESIHAEINLAVHFPLANSAGYIGISKLSCSPCNIFMKATSHRFRGTHGLYWEDDWKMPRSSPKIEYIKKELNSTDLPIATASDLNKQARLLSNDSEFETEPIRWLDNRSLKELKNVFD